MAINDVLIPKAARRYAIANAKWFLGPRDASELILMVSFTFAMRRHRIRLALAPFTSFRLAQFGFVLFADLRAQHLATKQNTEFTEGARKLRSYFIHLWTKVHEIIGQYKRPFVLSRALSRFLCLVSFRRYLPLSLEVLDKTEQMYKFLGPLFGGGGDDPTVLQQIVSAIYRPPFGKVWLSSVC